LFNFFKGFAEFEKRWKYLINAKVTKEKPSSSFSTSSEKIEKQKRKSKKCFEYFYLVTKIQNGSSLL